VKKGLLPALLGVVLLLIGPGVAQAAAPANDAFAAATPLAVGEEVSSSNLDATVEAGEPNPAGFSESNSCPNLAAGSSCGTSVWFDFQPALSGEYTIETCDGGTDLDTILGVYTGAAVGSLVQIGANDEVAGCAGGRGEDGSRVTFAAVGGTVYRIDLTGYGADQGSFYLRAYAGPAQARPQPDTAVVRRASVATVLNTLETGPGAGSGQRHSASFALASVAGAGFQCSLDGAGFSACATPVSYDGLAPGSSHVFMARAIAGGATDPTPAVARFTVDATPPGTNLTSGPTGGLASQEAAWTFSGSERYGPGFSACGLDSMPSFQCINTAKFEELCQGPHSFRAAAFDPAANADPTPATAQVNVSVGPPCAAPTVGTATSVFTTETGATVIFPFDNRGAGASLRLEYGPTTAYGMGIEMGEPPQSASAVKRGIQFLEPNTTYHFRVTITTPFGQASTPDQTLTTKPLESTRPSIANGTPTVTGEHAASIPVTIDPVGVDTYYRTLIAAGGPVSTTEPSLFHPQAVPGGSAGPQPVVVQVVDLEPATTYHYRIAAEQNGGNSNETLGPEGTFTTPPFPSMIPISGPGTSRFKLRKGQVRVGRLTRKSKRLLVKVRGLPAKSKVKLRLTVGKSKQTARKKAKSNGRVTFRLTLAKRIRKALLDDTVKRFRLKVTALPFGQRPSSVTFTKRIKG
jgi:hypothetical protein